MTVTQSLQANDLPRFLLLLWCSALLTLSGCSKELEFSQRRDIAQQFMNALANGDQAKASELSVQSPENKLGTKLMIDAIQLKIKNDKIKQFSYVYLSETQVDNNKTRIVFSQVQDGKSMPDNLVVELIYDTNKSTWLVHNLLMR